MKFKISPTSGPNGLYCKGNIHQNYNEVAGYFSSPPQKMCETKLVLISVFKSNANTNEQTIKVKCRVIKNEFKDVKKFFFSLV